HYVNLDEQVEPDAPHPEHGRCVRLRARIAWTVGDPSRSLAGRPVTWILRPDPGNRAELEVAAREGFDAAGSGSLRKETTTDHGGWTPVVRVYLSEYGGDRFELFVTEDPSSQGGQPVCAFTVWRKLWYQVTEMQTPDGGKLELPAAVTTALEAAL